LYKYTNSKHVNVRPHVTLCHTLNDVKMTDRSVFQIRLEGCVRPNSTLKTCLFSNLFPDMTHWNKDQWGAQQEEGYPPFYANGGGPKPGYSQPYAQTVSQPQYDPQGLETQKSPFEDGRFQPKKRVNDIFFLIFFILQVSTCCFVVHFL
jgi:hypothetical protein